MRPLICLFIICFVGGANAQVHIKNATIVDVENKKLIAGQDVLVENGSIAAIGTKLRPSAAFKVLDGTGRFLVPGWVDAHVHFAQSASIYTRPDAIDLRKYKSHYDEIRWSHENMGSLLRKYLAAGITTV